MEDEDYPISDWQYEVANGDTRLGYADWLESQREQRDDTNELEPIYRAQDAQHEASYGPRDDGYDD